MMDGFKSYLITDPSFYDSLQTFKSYLTKIYKSHKVDFACYRDKHSYSKEYAKVFLDISKKFVVNRVLLNSHFRDAKDLEYDGVHLTSKQFDKISYLKELGLYTIISCHEQGEILKAKSFDVDAVTFSPIFSTPNKGKPKGIEELKKVANITKVFALGGIIKHEQIQQVKSTNCYGFASIRYFV